MVLQTVGSEFKRYSDEPTSGQDHHQPTLNIFFLLDIFKARFFYFLGAFGFVSVVGLYLVAIQSPLYLSEGKILLQSQEIAPDIIIPVVTATASERAQLIQHRVMTRDNLLMIASKFRLFPSASDSSAIVDLMRKRTQIKPISVEVDGQLRPNSRTVAFTVGFEHESPEVAVRIANELVTLIVSGDENSRSSRTTEMIKLLTSQAKDLENQLESTQSQIMAISRRPYDSVPKIPDEQTSQLSVLAALKTDLTQKMAVYSDAHPSIIALKKKIATVEKSLAQVPQSPARVRSTPDEDMESLKRQQQALEKQLADANGKLASARLREKLDLEQQERMQVIESPSLPEKPVKSKKALMALLALIAGAVLGLVLAIGPELLNGSIRSRDQLAGVVDSSLIVCIPYITTQADTIRTRLKILFAIVGVLAILTALCCLVAAIVLHWQIDLFSFDRAPFGLR